MTCIEGKATESPKRVTRLLDYSDSLLAGQHMRSAWLLPFLSDLSLQNGVSSIS